MKHANNIMSSEFALPGIAAVILALLFPIYWILFFYHAMSDFEVAYRNDMMSLGWSDALFVLIGALEIYIYLSLRKALQNRLNAAFANILLCVMIGVITLFHSLVLFDVYLSAQHETLGGATSESLVGISLWLSSAALNVYSLVGLVFAILLLAKSIASSPLLKGFAVLLIIMCILQLTIVFAAANIMIFPIALLFLAVYFFKDPQEVEII